MEMSPRVSCTSQQVRQVGIANFVPHRNFNSVFPSEYDFPPLFARCRVEGSRSILTSSAQVESVKNTPSCKFSGYRRNRTGRWCAAKKPSLCSRTPTPLTMQHPQSPLYALGNDIEPSVVTSMRWDPWPPETAPTPDGGDPDLEPMSPPLGSLGDGGSAAAPKKKKKEKAAPSRAVRMEGCRDGIPPLHMRLRMSECKQGFPLAT